jgi:hypothetical protein
MDDRGEVTIEQQLADLAALKESTHRREGLRRGTPEWRAAMEAEMRATDRVRGWARGVERSRSHASER